MRKLVFILFMIMVLFFLNLVFYISSEDYRFFVKKIKYTDTPIYDTELEVNDNFILQEQNNNTFLTETNVSKENDDNIVSGGSQEVLNSDTGSLVFLGEYLDDSDLPDDNVIMTETDEYILSLFRSYNLKELEKYSSLFDITTEYPDQYFEFFSKNLSIYFFSSKSYSDVYDIFMILSDDLPFDINEVNNFGQASFYINLKEVYTDEYIRIVIQYENRAFGLKINKDIYNEVKPILVGLKPQK